ncbi:MAG: FAD synthase [Candidatus Thorarchaeota archaeon]|nr:FAD synthase [Candidatus Thorarchaeota archaeon]
MSGKRVLAAGKFDLLHLGHLAYLEQARELAGEDGELVVVVARDKTVLRERNRAPIFPEEHRRRIVAALRVVDRAILGYDTYDHTKIVVDIKPDIVALGYDQYADIEALEARFQSLGMKTKIVRLEKREADSLSSSTQIRHRIIEHYSDTI